MNTTARAFISIVLVLFLVNCSEEQEFKNIKHTEKPAYEELVWDCFAKLYFPDLIELNKGVIKGNFYASALKATHIKMGGKPESFSSEIKEISVRINGADGKGKELISFNAAQPEGLLEKERKLIINSWENKNGGILISFNEVEYITKKIIEGYVEIKFLLPDEDKWYGIAEIYYSRLQIEDDNTKYSGVVRTWYIVDNAECPIDNAGCSEALKPSPIPMPSVTEEDMIERCDYPTREEYEETQCAEWDVDEDRCFN